ncbi:hypothetical protein ACO2Q1_09080 [Brevundimonas sp. VNH65]|uniref:hypothetical protein n=1 Tax=Brevundimonas sp. VNH65 TaxID=3400917 RepID=UPI003C110F79
MALDLDELLEGAPSYGVIDARDGYLIYSRAGHQDAFDRLAAEIEASAGAFEVIPLREDGDRCDRLFIAPLNEGKSFAPRR